MRRNARLAVLLLVVAGISALLGAIFLAPILSGVQITIAPVPTAVALQNTVVPSPPPTVALATATALSTVAVEPTLAAAVEATATPSASPAVLTPTSDPDADPADTVIALLNAERRAAQCDVAIRLEPRLRQTAQAHAEDMARTSRIDHVGSDGATYSQRLDRAGYAYIRRGENIAAGFTTPREVVALWMDEPADGPHRVNILNCAYQDAGVGLALRADGYPYWVLDLAEPK
jgi:uncharacterized protein YkwD